MKIDSRQHCTYNCDLLALVPCWSHPNLIDEIVIKILAFISLVTALATPVAGQQEAFSPQAHRGEVAGPLSEIMVLGTPHLTQLPEELDGMDIAPLIGRLTAWQPDVIMIENLSGLDCAVLRDYADIFGDTAESYCRDPEPALSALGLTARDAVIRAEENWRDWPDSPSPEQRRAMAALLLAAGDPASALVQWLRLREEERRAADGLTDELAALLETLTAHRNESYAIAAHLAAQLGHERVYPIDNHSGIDPMFERPEYADAIRRAWSGPGGEARAQAHRHAREAFVQTGDVLAYYRRLNAPDYPELVFASDFGAAFADDSENWPARHYAAWWEVRNLRMVANIRAVLARQPGARALSIVGASHKGYFDAYLSMMTPIQLIDPNNVLGEAEE